MSEDSTKKNSLIRQLRDFGIGPIIGMGISMLTVPVTTRMLSPDEYGKSSLFTLFQSLFLCIGILGLDQGYVRYYNTKEIDRNNLLQNALFYPLIICAVLISICLIFLKPISNFLFGSVETGLMIAFCFFIPALLLNRFLLLQIRMDIRGKVYSFLNIISQLITFSVLFGLLVLYQKTFRAIIYSTIIAYYINTFIIFLFCDKTFIKQRFVYSSKIQKNLLSFSLPLVPATLLGWVLNSFDKVGLRTWSDFSQLGLYSAAFKIVALLNIFQSIFCTTWSPIAYKWHEEGVEKEKFENVSCIVLAGMVILFSLIIVFRDVIMLFLGAEYRNTSKIFIFLLFVPVLYTVSETTCLGIEFSKKTIYTLWTTIISVVLNLVGNFLLIPKYGAEGAAITTCFSYVAWFWLRTLFSRRLWFKFGLVKYIINILLLLAFCMNMLLVNSKIIELLLLFIVIIFNLGLILLAKKNKTNC